MAIVFGAIGSASQGVSAGFDFGCKLHWWSELPEMSPRGSITLGELRGKLTMLEIACPGASGGASYGSTG